jgi:O-antigen ligase
VASGLQPAAGVSLTAIAFVTIYGLGLLLAFVRHPSFGLLSYVWSFYNLPPSRWWGSELPGWRWSLIAAVVTAAALMWHKAARPDEVPARAPWMRSGGAWLLLMFVAWMWLQTLWAVAPDRNIEGAMLYTKYAVLSYVLYNILVDTLTVERFAWAHVLGCLSWGWTGFVSNVWGRWETVIGPGIDDSNVLGFHLVTGLAFAGFLFLTVQGRRRWLAFVAIPFILNGIILTASRSAMLGLIAAGIAALVLAPARHRRVVVGSLVLGLALLVMLARNDLFWERAISIAATTEMDRSAESRLEILRANWRMALDHPFGAGHQGNEVISPDYIDPEWLTDGRRSAHNTWMAVLVDQGIPGLVLYAGLYLWVVRLFLRRPVTLGRLPVSVSGCWAAAGAGVAAFLASGQFMNLFKTEVVLWLIAVTPAIETLVMTPAARPREADDADTVAWFHRTKVSTAGVMVSDPMMTPSRGARAETQDGGGRWQAPRYPPHP